MVKALLLAAVLAGCGGDNAPATDATPDAPEAPVALTVTRQSVPLAGIAVMFHRADGTLVDTIATDAAGRAEARTGAGGFVSAITPFASSADVKTFAGVQPGDALVIDGGPSGATPMTTYTVNVAQVIGAVFYRVSVRCLVGTGEQAGAATNPVELSVTTTCLAPTETLVTALDSQGFPIQSVIGDAATPTAGGVVDLTDAIPVTAVTAALTLANPAPGSTLESARSRGHVGFLAETEPATAGVHPTVLVDHAGLAQTVAITSTTPGARPVFAWGPATDTQTVDAAALAIAPIADPAIDRAARRVSWSGGGDANFVFGQLFVDGASPFLWSYAGPIDTGATAISLPALEGLALDGSPRIDADLAVARVGGDGALDGLRTDGAWLDANNGLQARPRVLLQRPPEGSGSVGITFVSSSLTF